jgi:N-acyl-D-aspartate/D-glutamate deacylase
MLDLKIVGGTVVDGTGAPGIRGDVGIRDGRVVAVGEVTEEARETIDATGRVVSPGFIDVHTHYDAQVFWDPALSPSCFHGVTTVVGGFCGFSIAPLTPASADYIKPMLARVEGMPLAALEQGVPWNWESFGDYLTLLDGRIGLNAGFFAGHSAIRRIVMGERAVGEKATPEELAAMQALLGRSLAQGALGFSTSINATHNDGDGNPVPSRWADHSEILALAGVVKDHEGTGLELLPDLNFGPGIRELMAGVSLAANRPVNWNVLAVVDSSGEARANELLGISDFAREQGGEVIALTFADNPNIYLTLRVGMNFDALPGVWREIFKWPVEERIRRFREPQFRERMAQDAASLEPGGAGWLFAQFGEYIFASIEHEANKRYIGRKAGDIAAEEGKTGLDVLLDIAIEDHLDTVLTMDHGGRDRATHELRGRLWTDDRTLIGASDAGAHLDQIDAFAFSTALLGKGVREQQVIGLEQAVHQMTQRPARYFGLVDRGVLAPGYHADIAVFDPATVARGPTYKRYDVPGGEHYRLYADAEGIDHVFVNGVRVVSGGEHTGQLPGTVLRSGRDTQTVPMDVLQDQRGPIG